MKVIASVLNVRSGPGTDFRVIGKISEGAEVQVLETHGDWSWIEPKGGWVATKYLERASPIFVVPRGLGGILEVFGEPGGPKASAGRAKLPAPIKVGWQNASVTVVACHVLAEPIFEAVFSEIHRLGLWGLLKTFDGIYNDRATRAGRKKSTHAWGIAVDLNASTNRMGTKGDMDERIVEIFEKHGFVWGGGFSNPDPMHFQLASGY